MNDKKLILAQHEIILAQQKLIESSLTLSKRVIKDFRLMSLAWLVLTLILTSMWAIVWLLCIY